MRKSTRSEIGLLLITICWGITFPLLHSAVVHLSPAALVFERFSLASFLVFFLVVGKLSRTNMLVLLSGLLLGILNVGAYLSQTISLETISASRCAFLTGISVLLVPFLSPLFRLGSPKVAHWLGSLICLIGLYLLTGAQVKGLSIGDMWGISCAVCVAFAIVVTQWISGYTKEYLLLTFYQLLLTALLSSLCFIHNPLLINWHINVMLTVIFCAVFATALTLFLQMKCQQHTSVIKAALIFSLEPVFASLFDFLLNHHVLSTQEMIGGLLILVSIIVPEINLSLKLILLQSAKPVIAEE